MLAPVECSDCHNFFHANEIEEHRNLHLPPSELRPKTRDHGMKKMEYSSAVHFDSGSDSTDIALRSLLPEEIPQDEREKQRVGLPDNDDFGNGDGNGGNGGYGGPANASDAARFRNYRNRDKLDLNSNLANNSLSNRDQLNKLNIEKQVELKQVKTMVPRKEVRKYQNDPYSGNQTIRDLGGCERKKPGNNNNGEDDFKGQGYRVGSDDPNNRNDGGRGDRNNRNGNNGNNFDGDNESGYKVMRDSGYEKNNNGGKKEAIFVPIKRRTEDPHESMMVDTKLNGDNGRRRRENGEESSENNDDLKKDRSRNYGGPYDSSRVEPYPGNDDRYRRYPREEDRSRNYPREGDDRNDDRRYPRDGEDRNRDRAYPREGEDRRYPREGDDKNNDDRDRRYPREGDDKNNDDKDRRYPREGDERNGDNRDRRYPREGEGYGNDRDRDRRYPREGYGYGYYVKDKNDYHDHGVHPHECPDCHGFYCRTCGATIPPQYRPFWDEDESPEMIAFYKKRIRAERERERKLKGECKYCNHPSSNSRVEERVRE